MDISQERTWLLSIHITDLSVDKTLRVNGDLPVGGVMFKLVESLAVPADWSDHALWWPEKCQWLTKSRLTLNQYGVHADAKLHFTPMHKTMKVQLPDLQFIDIKIDFSVNVFNAVIQLCKEMGVRHPEELSLLKPNNKDKKSTGHPNVPSINRNSRTSSSSNGSLNKKNTTPGIFAGTPQGTPVHVNSPMSTLAKTPITPQTPGTPGSWVNGMSPQALTRSLSFDEDLYSQLVHSPRTPSKEAFLYIPKHKSLSEKAAVNGCWLDSNKSLMEQAVSQSDLLYLKFKYFFFYDLNPKYDAVRINQIYEQAKWSLISEEIECTDEEMLMFAALQLQTECQSQNPLLDEVDSARTKTDGEDHDDIDAALNDLQVSLEGSSMHNTGDITSVPELQEYIKHFKPKRYTMKGAKRYYAVLKDTQIYLYKSAEDTKHKSLHQISLRDCDIQPDVNMSGHKFIIKLFIPGPECIAEEWLRCENEEQYARWMAACKLGSKGHTMADSSYNAEVRNIRQFLSLQKPSGTPTKTSAPSQGRSAQPVEVSEDSLDPANYVAPRFLKKNKSKLKQKILEAHSNVSDMPLVESKLNYIKGWQALPEYGLTYFLVKFRNNKKEEFVGVGYNRLIRVNPKTFEVTKTYRFSTMSSWSVHWENREVIVDFEEEKLAIKPLSADCKVFHEFLVIWLRCSFYDLNPKYDAVRINQIYEQAKWSLISEEIECTDEEMLMFAALQLQTECQSQNPLLDEVDSARTKTDGEDHDDIDAALNDLQVSLEGSSMHNTGDITSVPELQEYIKHFKPKRYTMKGAKRYYAVLKDTQIYLYKSAEDTKHKSLHQISLRDCDIQPDVNMSGHKFIIKLFIPGPECIAEEWLRCENEEQYARWMAACKLGSKGHTMADSSYNAEVRNIRQFLSLQKPSGTPTKTSAPSQGRSAQPVEVSEDSLDPANYVAPRFLKKNKSKLKQKILEAHSNVSDMPLVESKLNYIKGWQALPEYGLTYFLVKFRNNKKEEFVGVGYNRLIRVNPKTFEVTKTYRFSTMSSWSVHWENREVIVDFEEEKLAIKPLSADCKVFHEFLGGYIYLSMRSQDKNETLNEDMFYKLTSGTCG